MIPALLVLVLQLSGQGSAAGTTLDKECDGWFDAPPTFLFAAGNANREVTIALDVSEEQGRIRISGPNGFKRCATTVLTFVPTAGAEYEIRVGTKDGQRLPFALDLYPSSEPSWWRPGPVRLPGSAPLRAPPVLTTTVSDGRFPALETPSFGESDLGTLIKYGTAATWGNRGEALRAVVRLRSGRGTLCTGTLVEHRFETKLLTAAHCLFRVDAHGRFEGRAEGLSVEGQPALDLQRALIPPSFEACAQERVSYPECVGTNVPDVALVPFVTPPTAEPWRIGDPRGEREFALFGFGLDRGRLPSQLLEGQFVRMPAPSGPGLVELSSEAGLGNVEPGDSGGPAITLADDALLEVWVPTVRFVIAAVLRGSSNDPSPRSLVQPVGDIDSLLSR